MVGESVPAGARDEACGVHRRRAAGRRTFPWRVLAIADRDADLRGDRRRVPARRARRRRATGAGSSRGKSQSEWLWDNILYDVPFVCRLQYRHLPALHRVRRAVPHRLPLLRRRLVEGHRSAVDLTPRARRARRSCARHARRASTSSLWTLVARRSPARWGRRSTSSSAGVSPGIMVDFMDRDDQPMVAFYRQAWSEEAAKRRLFVELPRGLQADRARAAPSRTRSPARASSPRSGTSGRRCSRPSTR